MDAKLAFRDEGNEGEARQGHWILAAVALIAAIAAVHFLPLRAWTESISAWSAQFGIVGVFAFGLIFSVAAILMIPCLPLTILAGFTFGALWGLVAVLLGTAISAAAGFLFARHGGRAFVARQLGHSERFKAIDAGIARDGWKMVMLLRMCPVPFGLTNYLYGLTALEFWQYMGATLIGMLPGNAMFVYLGAFGKRTAQGPHHPLEYVLGLLALLAMAAVAFRFRQIARHTVDL